MITSVIPFSIHRAKNTAAQAIGRVVSLFLVLGFIRRTSATRASTTQIHIHGTRSGMSMESHEQIGEVVHVFGNLAVENCEELAEHKEYADNHGIGDDLRQRLDGFPSRVELGVLSQEKAEQNQQRRTGRKRRSQESGSHDRGEPETSSRKTRVQEGRHRMNADRPGYGQINERLDPLRRRSAFSLSSQHGPADDDVQNQISVQDDHIPEKDRIGRGVQAAR